jgi:hypothetical protein
MFEALPGVAGALRRTPRRRAQRASFRRANATSRRPHWAFPDPARAQPDVGSIQNVTPDAVVQRASPSLDSIAVTRVSSASSRARSSRWSKSCRKAVRSARSERISAL